METLPSLGSVATWLVVATCLASLSPTKALEAGQLDCAECARVVARAVKVLPQQPRQVVVIDRDTAPPALQQRIDGAEGFVTIGENTVYLAKQGSTFQLALRGPGISDYAVAITIWHEMAHIAGARELEAQCQEERLWQQFIVERRFDQSQGVRYLDGRAAQKVGQTPLGK